MPDDLVLLRRVRRDAADRHARALLAERYLPLARRLARRYAGRHDEPFDDLVQAASLGLVKAIEGFDPDRESTFTAYAIPTILGELRRHFRDRTWAVRVPRSLKEHWLLVERAADELAATLERPPTVSDIAAHAGLSEEVLAATQAGQAHRATSMDRPLGADDHDGVTIADRLGSDDGGFLLAEHRDEIASVAGVLTERERRVLALRFVRDMTQAEIGQEIGVSQMQVSRILRSSLTSLRDATFAKGELAAD